MTTRRVIILILVSPASLGLCGMASGGGEEVGETRSDLTGHFGGFSMVEWMLTINQDQG